MSILRAIFRPRWIGRSAGDVKSGAVGALFLASSKGLLDPPIRVSDGCALRKSPFRHAPESRLLRPRSQNLASSPSKAAQDRHETLSASDLAAPATRQNISGRQIGRASCRERE